MRYVESMVSVLLVIAVGCSLAVGQQPDRQRVHRPDSMQGDRMQDRMMGMMGMMQAMDGAGMHQMMDSPMHRAMMMVHLLPTMQDTLDLSAQQVQQIEQLRGDFQSTRQQSINAMQETREKLRQISWDEAPEPDQVRALFEQMAQQRADMMATAYETSVDMFEVLDQQQRRTLSQMGPRAIHRHMMAEMSMMEMMNMMRMMHGGMMKDGTMGSMMNGGPGGRHQMPSGRGHNR